MFVVERGSGPAVLLLHGTPSPATDWQPVAEALAREFRILIPDLPGYGRSPALAETTVESVGDALAEMLRERDIEELHAVVGFSAGAYRAFDLVLRRRVPVKVVIALAGMVTFDDETRAARRQFADMLEADPQFLDSDTARAALRETMLSPAWRAEHPEDDRRVLAWLHLASRAALVAELRALAEARDLRPELGHLAARVYARVGELDRSAPVTSSEDIVRNVPNGEIEVVAGCGHALLLEDLAATTAAIARRLRVS